MKTLSEPIRRLNFRLPHPAQAWPRLFAMTDQAPPEALLHLIDHLPKGSGLIFRHYHTVERQALARAVVNRCRRRGILCFIAGDLKLAQALSADGLHLPEYRLSRPCYGLSHFLKGGGRVSAAAHSRRAALMARRMGAEAVFVSPVFATSSHPGTKGLGIIRFARMIHHLPGPVYALGGQTPLTARRVRAAGAYGMAGISLFNGPAGHEDARKIG